MSELDENYFKKTLASGRVNLCRSSKPNLAYIGVKFLMTELAKKVNRSMTCPVKKVKIHLVAKF